MAKQGKTVPARRPRDMESSLFLRSAESLGRVIGTLQRQLDSASKRLIHDVDGADDMTPSNHEQRPRKTKKTKATKAPRATRKTAKKTTRAAAKKTKTTGAKKTTRR